MQNIDQTQVWDKIWSAEPSYHWDALSLAIYDALRKVSGDLKGKRVLEAGSGSGKISLCLAMDGADAVLADYSEAALGQSSLAFRRKGRTATFLREDIRQLSLADDEVDVCWNAGVLEHYEQEERTRIVAEMARVTRPGGRVVAFVPNARCLPYRLGKAYAEQTGAWAYGVEIPLASLREEFEAAGLEEIEESELAFETGLDFLDFLPERETLKTVIRQWAQGLEVEERALFPGYLIVASGKVKER
ncbi:class I SAM-dependent methyltransferase [Paenibacillus methanolicus]|uniref:Ubiquinone/menaquinone biosynthesis C-methylase UbiE n=1 Tax=Paenibacillus methanolicus TaxID=582686 RepID=A0A5S5CAB5_9BACL|nr:class I SAM-dependent methyltransferase [Paenibacillus methanolicus]TYP76345.1 ubiquinone/menaquinone biosynthesis C-methylase UbiE [Paenibacillus methanolicus]